jgi:CheY-like chemotaxis protein
VGYRQQPLGSGSERSGERPPTLSPPGWDTLVVEDDELIREQLADLLRTEGYTVATAANGEEALSLLERTQFGVVLLDLTMPVMSGWELAATMRRRRHLASIPVLTITAGRDLNRAPPGPVFIKPINTDSLLRAVAVYLRGRPS